MTIDELKKVYNVGLGSKAKRKYRHKESAIQQSCVEWFRYAYPKFLCFAVPNGGSRNVIEAVNMKHEGIMAGVADLIIIADHKILFVEMKSKTGKQQESQKEFQRRVEALGFRYVVCHSFDEFKIVITNWLGKGRL